MKYCRSTRSTKAEREVVAPAASSAASTSLESVIDVLPFIGRIYAGVAPGRKYHLVIAVECCIDIANHVIASENYRFPRDNVDSFAMLVAEGILPSESREPLEAMARFRNRLVHLYWDVDDLRIHDYLQEGLSDIESFGNAIAGREW